MSTVHLRSASASPLNNVTLESARRLSAKDQQPAA